MLVSLMATNGWASRERPDSASRFSLCKFQVVPCLQVHPELWGVTEPMSKPQRGVTSDPTFAVDYLSDPISRDGKLTRQLSRRHTNSFKTLGENSSRMMGCCGHIAPRNGQAIPPPKIRFLTMYVNRTSIGLVHIGESEIPRQCLGKGMMSASMLHGGEGVRPDRPGKFADVRYRASPSGWCRPYRSDPPTPVACSSS